MKDPRRMLYPYTFTAKIVQFPFRYHWQKHPEFKYFMISTILCLPIFKKIQDWSFSDEKVALRDSLRKKHIEELHDYIDSL